MPGFLRGWLRFWGIVEGVGLPALLLLITFSDIGTGWYSGLDLIAAIIGHTAVLYWVLGFPLIVLPFTLTMQARMRKELIAYPKRPPEVRRSAISPIMKVLSFHTIFFTFLLLMIAEVVLLFIPAGLPFLINFTWQGFMGFLFLVMLPIVLLYVLCLERPYRRSLRNWKTSQLAELTNLRKKFERLLREASSPLPVEKDPLSLQENYALWQFYCALEEDVKQASPAPFSFLHRGGAALLTLASGILVAYLSSNLNNLIHVMQQTPGH